MKEYIKIHADDMVAVALTPLAVGSVIHIDGKDITLTEDIPQGHKFALVDIEANKAVIKYGAAIGVAKKAIKQGSWVHTHNIKTGLGDLLTYSYDPQHTPIIPTDECYFQGFRRKDGKAGVRNEISGSFRPWAV